MFDNDNISSLLRQREKPGSTFADLATAYFSGSNKKGNRARNALLATLFLTNREARMQSEAIKSAKQLDESRKLDQLKLDDRLKQREKLLLDEEGYKELGDSYFFAKAKNNYENIYGGLGGDITSNPILINKRIDDIKEMRDELKRVHLANMENIERSEEGRILTAGELKNNIDKYYTNKQRIELSPKNISVVHQGIDKVKEIFNINKKSEYETLDSAYRKEYDDVMSSIKSGYKTEDVKDSVSGKVMLYTGRKPFNQAEIVKRKNEFKDLFDPEKSTFIKTLKDNDYTLTLRNKEGKQVSINPFQDDFDNIKIYSKDGSINPTSKTQFFDDLTLVSLQLQESYRVQGRDAVSNEALFTQSLQALAEMGHLRVRADRSIRADQLEFIPLGENFEDKVKNNTATALDLLGHEQKAGQSEAEVISAKPANEIFDNFISDSIKDIENNKRGLSIPQKTRLSNLRSIQSSLDSGDNQLYSKELIKFIANPPIGLGNIKADYDSLDSAYEAYKDNFGRDEELEAVLFNRYKAQVGRNGRQKLQRENINTYAQLNNLEPLLLAQN